MTILTVQHYHPFVSGGLPANADLGQPRARLQVCFAKRNLFYFISI
jgi:hypothetical protein